MSITVHSGQQTVIGPKERLVLQQITLSNSMGSVAYRAWFIGLDHGLPVTADEYNRLVKELAR